MQPAILCHLRPRPQPLLGVVLAGMLGLAWAQTLAQTATLSTFAPPSAASLPSTPAPTDAPLPEALQASLRAAGLNEAAVSVLAFRLDGPPAADGPAGAALIQHRTQQARPVASVMKLFTTGAALQQAGLAAGWQTDTGLHGTLDAQGQLRGDVWVRGSGDPTLVTERVLQMMVRWRAAGLRHIAGDLVLDRTAFELPPHDAAAFDGAALKPYNAGPDALLVNLQAVTLRLAPDAARPGQWQVSMEPTLAGVSVLNQVQAMPQSARAAADACVAGDWREALTLEMAPQVRAPLINGLRPWQVVVRGKLPLSCGPREWPVLWLGDGPGDHAARSLLASWQALGGTLGGTVRQAPWPVGLPVWQRWRSPPLSAVVVDINKFSNNVMARQLMLSLPGLGTAPLGAAGTASNAPAAPPVTLEQARDSLRQVVTRLTADGIGPGPCTPAAWQVDNGSGLSRDERSSAACLGRWLQVMWRSPVMPEWLASLPVVGVDGTARRWTGAAGQAHIKTGSLDGVATMAGVVDARSGTRWAVVALGQHPQEAALRHWYGQVLAWLVAQ